MTEDDTFKELAKPNFSELLDIMQGNTVRTWEEWILIINGNNWRMREYLTMYYAKEQVRHGDAVEKYVNDIISMLDRNNVNYV